MRRLAFLFIFLVSIFFHGQSATISSNTSGGQWNVSTTWVGNTVPTSNDNVIINGLVIITGNSCTNLTISSGATIQNRNGYADGLNVLGSLTNNGTIQDASSGYLEITIGGNIHNNGTWKNYYNNLDQNGNAIISQGNSKKFESTTFRALTGKADSIQFASDLTFISCDFKYVGTNRRVFVTKGYDAVFESCQLHYFNFKSNDKINLDKSVMSNAIFRGNGEISGTVDLFDNVYIKDNFSIKSTLRNSSGYAVNLYLEDNVVNNGSIANHPNSGYLAVYMNNNFSNRGTYHPSNTYLKSGNTHTLSQTAGNNFHGSFYCLQTDTIIMASNLYFEDVSFYGGDVNGSNHLKTNGFDLTFDTSYVEYLHITSNDSLILDGSLISNIEFVGNMALNGSVDLYNNCKWQGVVRNHGTIANRPGYAVTTFFEGSVVNYGKIIDHTYGGYLYVTLNSDIDNRDKYSPRYTLIAGQSPRQFKQSPNTQFEGEYRTEDTLGGIILASNVVFKKARMDWHNEFPYSTLQTNGNTLTLDSCDASEMRILSDDTLNLNGTLIYNTYVYGKWAFQGVITLYNATNFIGDFDNLGVIQNRGGYGIDTKIEGKINNYGEIIQHTYGGNLRVNLYSDIYNAGTYTPTYTYISGNKARTFSQETGKTFQGSFYTTDTLDAIKLGSDIVFKKVYFNWQDQLPYSSFITNGHTLKLDSCDVHEIQFVSNDTLDLNGTMLQNTHTYGNPYLTGEITLYNNTNFMEEFTVLGVLQNRQGYAITTTFEGNAINRGKIRRNPSGGSLNVHLLANLHNEGIYAPSNTYPLGGKLRSLSQDSLSIFEGAYYATDTSDGFELASNVHFKKAYFNWPNSSPHSELNTRGYTLFIDSSSIYNVRITETDTINFNGSTCSNFEVYGSPYTMGVLTVHNSCRFIGDITNIGTIQNNSGYSNTVTFEGNVFNEGSIKTNPNGGVLNVYCHGGLTNNLFFEPNYTYFEGNKSRTITGSNVSTIKGNYYINDTMTFVSENFLPNLYFNSNAQLTIDTSSSLRCDGLHSAANTYVINKGRINTTCINTTTNEFINYKSKHRFYGSSDIYSLEIEEYGHQQHPFTNGAINQWWRLKTNPLDAKDSLRELKLYYEDDQLNGYDKNDLRVYFSPNAGLSWERVSQTIIQDTSKNEILLPNAPAYGHYVLSGQDLGIVSHKPVILRAEPRTFGNKGQITVYGFGIGLTNNMNVQLVKSGSPTLNADSVYLTDAFGESFIATFNVDLADIGTYSLVLDIPGESPIELTDYFTVEKAERPEPWVVLSGRNRFLINRWQTFQINYGNTANTDAIGVPLFFVVNDVPGMEVEFPDFEIGIPKSFTDDGWTQWKDTTIDLYFLSDTFSGFEGKRMRIYPFYIPRIGATSSNSVRVKIKASADLDMTVWVTDPMIEGFEKQQKATTPPEVAACLAKVAAKYTWDKAIDLIPGYDCYKLAYKVTETGVTYALRDPNEPQKPETWGSWLISGWGWAWSIVDCAGDIIPVTKGVKIGKDLISLGFDIKSNYDANKECWDKFKAKEKGKHKSRGVTSFDPNEITGPTGYGADGYIGINTNMVYTVYFENKDTAQAAASDVIILDTLDKNLFNFETFYFNNITIADSTYEIQSFSHEFRILVDLAPRIHAIVQVTGSIDTATGAIKVSYLTLDRSTLEPNEDVDLGFLPPNKSRPEGEGNFSYSVALDSMVSHDEVITNKALIFFDANKPIETNVHSNKLDIKKPNSQVDMLPGTTTDSSFVVSWSGTDAGCGIESYSIFVSINDSPYVAWKSNTHLVSDTFFGNDKYNYKFYSIARDSIGHTESKPSNPDASTNVIDKSSVEYLTQHSYRIYPNPAKQILSIDLLTEKPISVKLWSSEGRLIEATTMTEGSNQLDLSHLSPNLYIIHLEFEDKTIKEKILLVR